MRKLLLIIPFILLSCDKDDDECTCTLEVTADGTSSYYVQDVPTDCDGNILERPDAVPSNHFILGCTD